MTNVTKIYFWYKIMWYFSIIAFLFFHSWSGVLHIFNADSHTLLYMHEWLAEQGKPWNNFIFRTVRCGIVFRFVEVTVSFQMILFFLYQLCNVYDVDTTITTIYIQYNYLLLWRSENENKNGVHLWRFGMYALMPYVFKKIPVYHYNLNYSYLRNYS